MARRGEIQILCGDDGKRVVSADGDLVTSVTPHSLRRTFGSDLVRRDVATSVFSGILGHSAKRVTEESYTPMTSEDTARKVLLAAGEGPFSLAADIALLEAELTTFHTESDPSSALERLKKRSDRRQSFWNANSKLLSLRSLVSPRASPKSEKRHADPRTGVWIGYGSPHRPAQLRTPLSLHLGTLHLLSNEATWPYEISSKDWSGARACSKWRTLHDTMRLALFRSYRCVLPPRTNVPELLPQLATWRLPPAAPHRSDRTAAPFLGICRGSSRPAWRAPLLGGRSMRDSPEPCLRRIASSHDSL